MSTAFWGSTFVEKVVQKTEHSQRTARLDVKHLIKNKETNKIHECALQKHGCVDTHDVRRGLFYEIALSKVWVYVHPRRTAKNICNLCSLKTMGVWTPTTYGEDYSQKMLFGKHGCMHTHDVLRVSFLAKYAEG